MLVGMGTSAYFDSVVFVFPSVLVCPQEGEPQCCRLFWQWDVDKLNVNTRGLRSCIDRMKPFIGCPMQQEREVRLDAQVRSDRDCRNLPIEFPDFDRSVFRMTSHVSIECGFDQVTAFAIPGGVAQLYIFRMRL
jgi:hypothetical protein